MSYGKVNKSNGDRIPYATGAIDNSKIGDLDNLTTTNKSNLVSAINEVNSAVSTKQDKTDNNLTTSSKTVVGSINEIRTNMISMATQLFFGSGNGKQYNTYADSIDACVDAVVPTSDYDGYFSIINNKTIMGYGNRQFIFGWLNNSKTYGWCLICCFDSFSYGSRRGASTFTITELSNLMSFDYVSIEEPFYCETNQRAQYAIMKYGTHGIVQVNGILKTGLQITAGTEYQFCTIPNITSSRRSIGMCSVNGDDAGSLYITENSNVIKLIPKNNIGQYNSIDFSISFVI